MEGGGNYTLGNRARITGCQKETRDSLRAPQDEFPWADRCKQASERGGRPDSTLHPGHLGSILGQKKEKEIL